MSDDRSPTDGAAAARRRRRGPLLLLGALAVLFFAPALLRGRTFYAFDALFDYLPWSATGSGITPANPLITDPVNLFYPMHRSFAEALRRGRAPVWDPATFGGMPHFSGFTTEGNPLFALLLLLLPVSVAHDVLLVALVAGTGILTFLYLAEIGLSPPAATLGAVAWMFNGYVLVWLEFEHVILACALPASLLFLERWLRSRRLADALGLSAAAGFGVTVGYAHLILYQGLFLLGYLLYRAQRERRRHPAALVIDRRLLGTLLAAGGPALLIAASFLVSHAYLLAQSQRQPLPFAQLWRQTGQLPLRYLATALFPDFYGSPAAHFNFTPRLPGLQPYNNYSELCLYAGVAPLLLAWAALPVLGRRPYVSFYAAVALLALTMAAGNPLYWPLARFLPGLDLSTPTRLLYLYGFSVAVLAAIGADRVLSGETRGRRLVLVGAAAAGVIALALAIFVQTEVGARWAYAPDTAAEWATARVGVMAYFAPASRTLGLPLVLIVAAGTLLWVAVTTGHARLRVGAVAGLVVVAALDLMAFGLRYDTTVPRGLEYPPTGAIRFLQQDPSKFRVMAIGDFLHNALGPFGLEDVGGYSSFYPRRYGELLHLSQHGPALPPPASLSRWMVFERFGSPLLDLLNTRYLLLPRGARLDRPALRLVYDGEVRIYRNEGAFPRCFGVSTYRWAANPRDAYRMMGLARPADLRASVVLEERPPGEFAGLEHADGAAPTVALRAYEPDRMAMDVDAAAPGFVVVADSYASGWTARVDGHDVPVLRADYVLRAVPVSAGRHRLEMRYRPLPLLAGLVLSASGWVLLAVLLLAARARERPTAGRVPR